VALSVPCSRFYASFREFANVIVLYRRIFSKIRSDAGYLHSKETAIALALSLQLGKQQAIELLGAAGYTLSKSATFDLIISFCLEQEIYDLCDVNDILEYFGEHLLGE
jgi:hypothetical protein